MNVPNDSKEIVLFFGEIKTPPFSKSARIETGFLLRKLQAWEMLSMPESRPMPTIGKHCHELRVGDSENNKEWRVIYRIDEDEIVVFDILSPATIRSIVALQIEDVIKRLRHKEIVLSIADPVLDYIAKEGYDPKFGARPLKRVIQSKILTPVASMMVGEGMLRGGTVRVDMKKDELTFDIKKRARAGASGIKKAPNKTAEPVK